MALNEKAVVDSLKSLLIDNEADILAGLTYQGQQAYFHAVVTTNLAPPSGYPWLLVYCNSATEKSRPTGGRNMRNPSSIGEYAIQIEYTDQAQVTYGEEFPYQEMHDTHRIATDRMVNLIEEQTWIGTAPKLKLKRDIGMAEDRIINKENLSGQWFDTENNLWATLHTQLTFILVDECANTTPGF